MATLSLTQLLGKAESMSSSLQAEAARLARVTVNPQAPKPDLKPEKKDDLPGEEDDESLEAQVQKTQQIKTDIEEGKDAVLKGEPLSLNHLIQRGMLLGETYDTALQLDILDFASQQPTRIFG